MDGRHFWRLVLVVAVGVVAALWSIAPEAHGFGAAQNACEGECKRCHSLSAQEASDIVKQLNPEVEVESIDLSPVGGLWEVIVIMKGKRGIAYIDFAKKHIVTGSIIKVEGQEDVTMKRYYELAKVDIASIPIEEALLVGNPDALYKVIVFDDPNCAFCRKLHQEIKKVAAERTDIAFYIKMLPLKIHPESYKLAKSIVCSRSVRSLESAFDGQALPEPSCQSSEVDNNILLAESLGITSTPTMVLPDGNLMVGYKEASELVAAIQSAGLKAKIGQKPEPAATVPQR